MRWRRGRRSQNLEDRRFERRRRRPFGLGRARAGGSGLRLPFPRGRGGLSLGSIAILLVLFFLFRGDGLDLLGGDSTFGPGTQVSVDAGPLGTTLPRRADTAEETLVDFVSFVLDDIQGTWAELLPGFREARLVLFRDEIRSACGFGQAAMGPFYCPGDQKVYIDLSFYHALRDRFGAPGDFAQAYVLAHEIGHHVQKLTGIETEVRRNQQARRDMANALSVRMELQADCFAGVWGHAAAARGLLEPGDVEEGLTAAAAIGDDRMQSSRGRVHPESFTHGSSEQRVAWLRRGLESGDVEACDTFDR